MSTPKGRRRRRDPRKGKLEQRLDFAKECLVEEMLHVLSGSAPRAAVDANSVANFFLAGQLIREEFKNLFSNLKNISFEKGKLLRVLICSN